LLPVIDKEENMNFVKRLLMVAGAVALAAIFGALLAPKAAHGIVATLVQVVNTSANPVPTLATDALRSFGVTGSCSLFGTSECLIRPIYTVPAGEIAVIESTSGRCFFNAGNLNEALLEFQNATNTVDMVLERTKGNAGNGAVETWTHSVKGYAFGGSAGTPINAAVFFDSAESGGDCFFEISGHLISQ
jgi:hypothetical protein